MSAMMAVAAVGWGDAFWFGLGFGLGYAARHYQWVVGLVGRDVGR